MTRIDDGSGASSSLLLSSFLSFLPSSLEAVALPTVERGGGGDKEDRTGRRAY